MSARSFGVYVVAAGLVAGLGPLALTAHAAGTAATAYPKAGCFTLSDPKGDAKFDGQAPNDPDMDILGVAFESTKTDLIAFAKVDKLAAGPQATDGHRYTFDFTFNGHVFSAAGSSYSHGTGAIRDGLAQTNEAGHTTQLGVDVPSLTAIPPAVDKGFKTSGLKITFDVAKSWVVFDLPIADIQKYGGAKFGGILTAVDVKSAYDSYAVSSQVDSSAVANAAASTDMWKVGANTCFAKKKKH
jgi:hypothetical protein